MPEKDLIMGRRAFLFKTALFFAGSLLGFKGLSTSVARACTTNPKIAIIIDDIGFSKDRLYEFLDIGACLTFSILPKLPMSAPLAEKIHSFGYEIMLHQPMEPLDPAVDPGPGAVYVEDPLDKITNTIKENINETPYVTGINNHMGSRFTACGNEMKEALTVVRESGLFFVDSLTTNRSTGYRTARTMNISAARRNIFIDNVQDEAHIAMQLENLKGLAQLFGHATGIGHPFPETARAVRGFYNNIRTTDISMVPVSTLLT
ncbi:MAG: divergent polysaccharide deacetylase family protein [Deltaproteobacteria bacterium]|nr:divergent polysaccharide deacetylase family protein [Deltaproteobacteria bacterium]